MDIYTIWYDNVDAIEDAIGWKRQAKLGRALSQVHGKGTMEEREVTKKCKRVLKNHGILNAETADVE